MANQTLWRVQERCVARPFPPGRGGNGGKGGEPGEAGKGGNGGDVYFLGTRQAILVTRAFTVSNFGGENGQNGLPGVPGHAGRGGKGGTTRPACGSHTYPDAPDGSQGLISQPLNPLNFEAASGNIVEVEIQL